MKEFGLKAKCQVTGLEGYIVAYCYYMNGAEQYLVQPPCDKDGKHVDATWIIKDFLFIYDEKVQIFTRILE